jgi:hypothetical protein
MSVVIPSCPDLAAVPAPLSVTLPGGVSVASLMRAADGVPQELDLVQSLMAEASPALAPLKPVFDILDAVTAVHAVLKAIPGAFGPPPDPTKITDALGKLAPKIDNLLRLVPQLSVPLLAKDLLDALVTLLLGLAEALQGLAEELQSLGRVADRATALNDPRLASIAACAQRGVVAQAATLGASLAGLGSLLGLLNTLLDMAGLPEVPDLTTLAKLPLGEILAPLSVLVDALRVVRRAIP